ncbi:TSUP family transporter [Bordetella petrii]|uniref:TSUP family transporter n=1 Tax=Bordetella petrii TaxID=94624 RepID=UPI001E579F37|nr:TSUP family transporter [Bordetella petrii]MCD0503270.1 TSUP family transporter [Bordetella petrii]
MTWVDHLLFMGCVALATYAQTMTGFAFGLVLLGLTGLFALAPLPDVSNVVSMLTLVNALVALGRAHSHLSWSLIRPPLIGSLAGVVLGVLALEWISGSAALLLRWLLGLTILACAILLVTRTRPLARVSSRLSFILFGGISGVLGGLFSSAGPPMVYHLYRQPLPLPLVRNTLLVLFSANAVVRLTLVAGHGSLNASSLWLSLEAFPIVVGLTWLVRRYVSAHSVQTVKKLVFVLLLLAGLGLLIPATRALLA